MIGTLNQEQIEHVLQRELIGRIGFLSGERIFILPVAFAYSHGYIYAHSKEGAKVKQMRKHPHVSFQADSIDNLTNWRSVLLWGTFEEIKSPKEQQKAIKILSDRIGPFTSSQTTRTTNNVRAPQIVEKPLQRILYRIRIDDKVGKFEKSANS